MTRFDDALPLAVAVLRQQGLEQRLSDATFIRDASGTLTLALPDDALPADSWETVAHALHETLQRFSPGMQRVLLRQSDLVDAADVLASPDRVQLTEHDGVWLVDRVLTNQDWLRDGPAKARLPTAAAFSLKGGVGRSTAFAVLAWHLARLGRRVLVIDLDLEAPGIGAMLLPELPDFGVIDWCVEALVGAADAELLERMILPAPLASGFPGNVWVAPAFGRQTREYVSKLGRAYMTAVEAGRFVGLAERLTGLLDQAARRIEPPDVLLLDTRAGLHDIGSAVVTQLGAEVLMFARNDPSTWDAYGHLFKHLRRARSVTWGMPDEDLRWRLKMVAAQTEPTASAFEAWIRRSYLAWTEMYDAERKPEQTSNTQDSDSEPVLFPEKDQAAPHYPLSISFDTQVRGLDFTDAARRPDWEFLRNVFGEFLDGATARLLADETGPLQVPPP
jgi:hypothetical protein